MQNTRASIEKSKYSHINISWVQCDENFYNPRKFEMVNPNDIGNIKKNGAVLVAAGRWIWIEDKRYSHWF